MKQTPRLTPRKARPHETKAPRTANAVRLVDKMIGNDAELHELVAEAALHAEIAQLIYDARTSAGLTQKQLADLVGTRQSAIARLEDADYDGHSLAMLNRIAEALDRHVEILLAPNRRRRKGA